MARGLLGVCGLWLTGCHRPAAHEPAAFHELFPVSSLVDAQRAAAAPLVTRHPIHFTDVARPAHLHWAFTNGATGRHLFVETAGGGVAFLDYNHDGRLDIFAVQGGPEPGATRSTPRAATPPTGTPAERPRNILYRNNGDGTFSDITISAGLGAATGYGQGVAAADYDNDGWTDLYLTAYGGNHLLHNNGNGTFTDVTSRAGVTDTATVTGTTGELPWPLSAAWGDYDNDGNLDLFVCHYVRWSLKIDKPCRSADNTRLLYCRPQVYEPSRCRLYHNNGNGTFSDVTQRAGLGHLAGKSMGVAWLDFDEDGWMDLFVTNDNMPNFLLHNNRNGTFSDRATLAGVAVGTEGAPLSGMGVGVGDYNNDGHEDLFATNFSSEPKSVFANTGHGLFTDETFHSNMASTNLQFLGFGLECCDYDLDGYKDLVVGNGHVLDWMDEQSNGSTYAQSQQLLHNAGNGTFVDDLHSLGDLVQPRITRGLAVGDYDNDGDLDIVMSAQNGPLQLFRNEGGNANHWLTLRLEGTRSNRDAIGAKVVLQTQRGTQTQWVRGGSSYCSHSDARVTFGLGDSNAVKSLRVRWPSGARQVFSRPAANKFYYLHEGATLVPEPRFHAPSHSSNAP